jgi:hypothetical protein
MRIGIVDFFERDEPGTLPEFARAAEVALGDAQL